MFRARFLVILLTAVMAAGVGGSAYAQEKPKDDPKLTETGPYVVTKGKIADILGKDDKVIRRFPTTEKAQAFAKEMNEKEPKDSPFTYNSYRKEPEQDAPKATGPDLIENTGPKGKIITKPDLKTVDPGAMKLGGKAKPVAGKTGTGTIGKSKVTITFTGKDGKGKFTVGGDLTGEGEWKQDGAGVVFETRLSRFVGNIEGDKLKGQRFTKKPGEDGGNAMTEWSVTLKDSPTMAGTKWGNGDPKNRYYSAVIFEEDGSLKHGYPNQSGRADEHSGTWKVDGDGFRVEYKHEDNTVMRWKIIREGENFVLWYIMDDGSLQPHDPDYVESYSYKLIKE